MVKINPLFYTLTNLTLEGPWYHIADCSIRVTSISGAILSRIFIVRTGAGGTGGVGLMLHCYKAKTSPCIAIVTQGWDNCVHST